ncbi:UDP-N-acetylmuramoyl-tripeptide--D-alanyl-D-alanine ligase [Arsukibacterium tuosuense]|uniref:UDP-N-acetylmuramoyl-tripeptide--D-alanyl-D-alanine ligase n=1 Tax=Arsukibacterium tuosuense TaxID=1323745 RepID=A0A285JK51_9GAMM|nr:UDP-N-acetylmuramoyl-tripeptide--D-alanyl-D-alanine ligase [Arsukibacterium tuosuense]SNY60682.1 UDP-N-acetylmuramoyl-tripeptide--D-alanyl-D-alanine ligase [Arsukibacterium tuosuense]
MITLSCAEIASLLQGQLIGDNHPISDVSTDSRTISRGALFIALKGPNFDGSRFVADVMAKGAAAIVVDRPLDCDISQIIVADTRQALGQLGAAIKARLQPKTIAVTGSAGKTTVKEMLAAILSRCGQVLATQGNFNNDIGVPLTLLRLTEKDQYAVMELGANHAGEIAYTTSLVKPDVAIITNAAASHLEGFGDTYGVARAKGEIFSGIADGGIAIMQHDSEFTEYWRNRCKHLKIISFASDYKTDSDADNSTADIRAEQISLNSQGCAQFKLIYGSDEVLVQLNLPGKHNVANALAAAAAAVAVGARLSDVQLGLAQMAGVKGRTNIIELNPQIKLIDDSYNANVESAKAAIDLLASYPGYRVLLLGDMAELGANARLYHEEIGLYAKHAGINLLFTLGVLSQSASDLFNGQGSHFSSRQSMLDRLIPLITTQQSVTILVKGSRSAKMELVVQDLLERCQQERSPC